MAILPLLLMFLNFVIFDPHVFLYITCMVQELLEGKVEKYLKH